MKTIEEKARAYDEAIRKLRGMMPNWERLSYNGKTFLQDLIYIIPELAESEDEKVRKALITFFQRFPYEGISDAGTNVKEAIAWLEKQAEQKPQRMISAEAKDAMYAKPAWSEEDERIMNGLIDSLTRISLNTRTESTSPNYTFYKEIDWLKSLRPLKRWKPSEEQIKVCKEVYADILSAKGFNLGTVNSELNRLEEELKKKGE